LGLVKNGCYWQPQQPVTKPQGLMQAISFLWRKELILQLNKMKIEGGLGLELSLHAGLSALQLHFVLVKAQP
jgi:hypothetical protein